MDGEEGEMVYTLRNNSAKLLRNNPFLLPSNHGGYTVCTFNMHLLLESVDIL